MKIQLLVPTMEAVDFSKVTEMNLHNVDVIFANQADKMAYEEKEFPERNVRAVMVSTNTRGVSLNRNIALAYASGDIIVFADDDQILTDDFSDKVLREFQNHPEADAIKFSCESTNPQRPLFYHNPQKFQKAQCWSIMSAGVHALALRREKFEKYDIRFSNSIGPGNRINCGEDSDFLKKLIWSPLRIYRSPEMISYVKQDGSTWFHGYDEHYFITSGYIYEKVYGWLAGLFLVRKAWKLRKKSTLSFAEMVSLQRRGVREYRDNPIIK